MDHLMNCITDPDVLWLAGSGEMLRPDYINAEQDLLWKDSPSTIPPPGGSRHPAPPPRTELPTTSSRR